jgi:hypothetical protein
MFGSGSVSYLLNLDEYHDSEIGELFARSSLVLFARFEATEKKAKRTPKPERRGFEEKKICLKPTRATVKYYLPVSSGEQLFVVLSPTRLNFCSSPSRLPFTRAHAKPLTERNRKTLAKVK